MSAAAPPSPPAPAAGRLADLLAGSRLWSVGPQQAALVLVILFELVGFGLLSPYFLSTDTFALAARDNLGVGLVALAMTGVILTGGIDLSVGSAMGMCAVIFGALHRGADWPWELAALAAVLAGAAGGWLNAVLVTRRRIPPLIVTLGTMALFRGIAEGIGAGGRAFPQPEHGPFDAGFLWLGRGDVLGLSPLVWLLPPAAVAWHLLVHRSVVGRTWSAIGYSAEGARYAGLRVSSRTGLAYVLAGVSAAVAALAFAADNGSVKSDVGFGRELTAIAVVVLGGTSIFGGRASVPGTLLALAAVALLDQGQTAAELPRESAGVLTGVLLMLAAGLDAVWTRTRSAAAAPPAAANAQNSEELEMRNSQLAVLCGVIVLAALVIAGATMMVGRSIREEIANSAGGGTPASGPHAAGGGQPRGKKLTVAVMPKSKGNAYFIACQKGADKAAAELGVKMIWDAPTESNAEQQKQIVDRWVTQKVDAISVAVEDAGVLSDALARARAAGIKVVTWDSDARQDARDFFCNQGTDEGIGDTLLKTANEQMGGEGEFVIISGTQSAANLTAWRKRIESQLSKYPKLKLLEVQYCDDLRDRAAAIGREMLIKHAKLKLIMAICSPAVPGAAEAVERSNRKDVKVIGLGLPNENKPFVHKGLTQAVILWKTEDLGYLAVHAAKAVTDGSLAPGATEFDCGRLGKLRIEGSSVILGEPFVFTKENIDQFDF